MPDSFPFLPLPCATCTVSDDLAVGENARSPHVAVARAEVTGTGAARLDPPLYNHPPRRFFSITTLSLSVKVNPLRLQGREIMQGDTRIAAERDWAAMASDWGHDFPPKCTYSYAITKKRLRKTFKDNRECCCWNSSSDTGFSQAGASITVVREGVLWDYYLRFPSKPETKRNGSELPVSVSRANTRWFLDITNTFITADHVTLAVVYDWGRSMLGVYAQKANRRSTSAYGPEYIQHVRCSGFTSHFGVAQRAIRLRHLLFTRRQFILNEPNRHQRAVLFLGVLQFLSAFNFFETLHPSLPPGLGVAERLTHSPPTKANRVQSPAGLPDFRKWESCRTMPLVGGFSRGSPASPAPSFRRRSIFTSIALVGSRDLAKTERYMPAICDNTHTTESFLEYCSSEMTSVQAHTFTHWMRHVFHNPQQCCCLYRVNFRGNPLRECVQIWRASLKNATFEESPQDIMANRQIGQAMECPKRAKLFDAETLFVKCPLADIRRVLWLHLDGNKRLQERTRKPWKFHVFMFPAVEYHRLCSLSSRRKHASYVFQCNSNTEYLKIQLRNSRLNSELQSHDSKMAERRPPISGWYLTCQLRTVHDRILRLEFLFKVRIHVYGMSSECGGPSVVRRKLKFGKYLTDGRIEKKVAPRLAEDHVTAGQTGD
ncbi:hypothetical protein PR048_020366 [Dryococelus australis]|uniref:Uncharacterized protein n=1 Tax=Dryococelus australis TaxID=614101 RepID=A0ABQ9H6H4_9NEOP|nr:hypothetical protein PR048_020366 [Dryococelus australis]